VILLMGNFVIGRARKVKPVTDASFDSSMANKFYS